MDDRYGRLERATEGDDGGWQLYRGNGFEVGGVYAHRTFPSRSLHHLRPSGAVTMRKATADDLSAVAVEEKSILDYNAGNPDGILDSGEQPRKPRVPLVAVYPKDGTLFSDNSFFVLDAPWVSADEKKAARLFETFVQRPENQRKVLEFGFRPGNPSVQVAAPIVAANGVDPSQPQTTLGVPAPDVLSRLLDKWGEQRKAAKVLLVID